MKSMNFLSLWKVSFYCARDNVELWSKAKTGGPILLGLFVCHLTKIEAALMKSVKLLFASVYHLIVVYLKMDL